MKNRDREIDLAFLLGIGLMILLGLSVCLSAQQPAKAASKIELTELETLQISIMMKDVLLANQQIQILQTQFQRIVAQRDAAQAEYEAMVERLRVAHKAPADKFDFNTATLKFVPLPKEEVSK